VIVPPGGVPPGGKGAKGGGGRGGPQRETPQQAIARRIEREKREAEEASRRESEKVHAQGETPQQAIARRIEREKREAEAAAEAWSKASQQTEISEYKEVEGGVPLVPLPPGIDPHSMSMSSNTEGLQQLLDTYPNAIFARKEGGMYDSWLPLHGAAYKGHLETVQLLVQRGAPVDAKTKKLDTALRFAASKGHAHVVTFLLEAKADPAIVNLGGVTALESARLAKSDETVRVLEAKC